MSAQYVSECGWVCVRVCVAVYVQNIKLIEHVPVRQLYKKEVKAKKKKTENIIKFFTPILVSYTI